MDFGQEKGDAQNIFKSFGKTATVLLVYNKAR